MQQERVAVAAGVRLRATGGPGKSVGERVARDVDRAVGGHGQAEGRREAGLGEAAVDEAAGGAGADVLCDPMVDTRGGAFTIGLGMVAPTILAHGSDVAKDLYLKKDRKSVV